MILLKVQLFHADFSHQFEEDSDKEEGEEAHVESWGWHSFCSRERLRRRASQFILNGALHVHARVQVCLPVRHMPRSRCITRQKIPTESVGNGAIPDMTLRCRSETLYVLFIQSSRLREGFHACMWCCGETHPIQRSFQVISVLPFSVSGYALREITPERTRRVVHERCIHERYILWLYSSP